MPDRVPRQEPPRLRIQVAVREQMQPQRRVIVMVIAPLAPEPIRVIDATGAAIPLAERIIHIRGGDRRSRIQPLADVPLRIEAVEGGRATRSPGAPGKQARGAEAVDCLHDAVDVQLDERHAAAVEEVGARPPGLLPGAQAAAGARLEARAAAGTDLRQVVLGIERKRLAAILPVGSTACLLPAFRALADLPARL
jgi:hypothetical protein